ncbi:hypothetical protein EC957_002824 [Mortierella hygrophila]|uniref:Uncharacterized protein n=1 Tax=Mortierella hygrophila TaxID=979708 RepID=A0A9P6FFQ5_9FUNG|nr:hypothetical protein EC957_002824 [Mortierella hygrophila]
MRFSAVFVAMAAIATATITAAAPATTTTRFPRTTTTTRFPRTTTSATAPTPTATPTFNKTLTALNYALSLEHLQAEFYRMGLAKFNESAFTNGGFHQNVHDRFVQISDHENEHVAALTSAIASINGTAVPACNYTFPMDNLTQFLTAAQAIENTGVSAYLGAVSGLRGNLLTTIASIATVEARHASYVNELLGESGIPYAFDTALGPREVATLATNFVSSCPYNMTVEPFTRLNATLPASGSNSTMVTTSFEGVGANLNTTFCQFLFGNNVTVSPRSQCDLPMNATGYVFVLITKNQIPISLGRDSNVLAGPALLFNNGTLSSGNPGNPGNGTQTNGTQTS